LVMKVFQIGFNKCGTRTIHRYFQSNGIKSIHWDKGRLAKRMFVNLANGDELLTGYEAFDVFSDMEYLDDNGTFLEAYKLFPYLAVQYPNAVFILNTRDREDWIRSRLRHSNGSYAVRQRAHYNAESNENLTDIWRAEWERHHRRAVQYFADKPHRFFICRIETDLPHLLNDQLPEWRLNRETFKLYNVSSTARRPGLVKRCVAFAQHRFQALFSLRSPSA